MSDRVFVNVSGVAASGKTTVASVIYNALKEAGFTVGLSADNDGDGDSVNCEEQRKLYEQVDADSDKYVFVKNRATIEISETRTRAAKKELHA